MKLKPIYIAIGAGVVVVGFAYWCFSSGPCQSNATAPDGTPAGIAAKITSVFSSDEQELANSDATGTGAGLTATIQGTVDNVLNTIGDWWAGIASSTGNN
jgi:hypothetical protein